MKKVILILILSVYSQILASQFETITFPASDGLFITADVYFTHPKTAPFIVLFHQAGFSRGEYREIAPELNVAGFNAMAIDQRSGEVVNSVFNETAKGALEKKLANGYLDALPDLEAAIHYSKKNYAKGQLILWGSSYSASLVLKLAGDQPTLADGVLAFAPGEYFARSGKSKTFISESAKKIEIPVFITSAKSEKDRWWSIYLAISSPGKQYFLPETAGIHGSKALWASTPENQDYWNAVNKFLSQFQEVRRPSKPTQFRSKDELH